MTRELYTWPRIAAVEYGNGSYPALPSEDMVRRGKELVVRVSGGMEWCPIAKGFHTHQGGARRTWFVLGPHGAVACCAHKECLEALGRPRAPSVRAPPVKFPEEVRVGMQGWLKAIRASAAEPCRVRREPSPAGKPSERSDTDRWLESELEDVGEAEQTTGRDEPPRKRWRTLRER